MRILKSQCLYITTFIWLSGTLHAQPHLKLDAKQAENFGVRSVVLQSSHQQTQQLAEARVLDPSVLYSQMAELDLSTSSLAFSSAQLASTRRLFENQQNASRTALAQATLLMRTDQNNLARAQTALRTSWGDAVADWPSAERAWRMAELRAGRASFVRLELNSAASASTRFSTNNAHLDWVGMLANADAQTGRAGALLWLKPGAPALSRIQVQLSDASGANSHAETTLLIPRSAVLRINGGYFVFIATATPDLDPGDLDQRERDQGSFEMRELIAPTRSADGWLVQEGFSAGERVVTAGAASLLTMARGVGDEE